MHQWGEVVADLPLIIVAGREVLVAEDLIDAEGCHCGIVVRLIRSRSGCHETQTLLHYNFEGPRNLIVTLSPRGKGSMLA
jgi:hypothetical protein